MQKLSKNCRQLDDRWVVLINEINRYEPGEYPLPLCTDVLRFIRETERVVIPDPFEQDLIYTARTLAETGDPKVAMFKVHEVINGRLGG